MLLLSLNDDCLCAVLENVPSVDHYCAARACGCFRARLAGPYRSAVWSSVSHLRFAIDDGMVATGAALADVAARLDATDELEWLHKTGRAQLSHEVLRVAASHGSYRTVQWLTLRNCPHDIAATAAAARHGHLRTLRWLRVAHGEEYDYIVVLAAASGGQMRILEYALDHELPMSEAAPEAAALGDRDALQMLVARGCPCRWPDLRAEAQRFHLHRILECLDRMGSRSLG